MWKNERTALILKRGKEVIPAMLFGIPSLDYFLSFLSVFRQQINLNSVYLLLSKLLLL